MPASFQWLEDNGASTGSPAHGTVQATAAPQVNWKNLDDVSTVYSTVPITAGQNSYEKFQYGHFTGTFTLISAGLWAHTAGSFGTGLTLKGTVTSTYTTPGTATNAALSTDMTTAIAIGSGLAVNFSTTSPQAAGPTSTLAAAGYTQYLVTQLQTTSLAAAGDTSTATLTLQYSEN